MTKKWIVNLIALSVIYFFVHLARTTPGDVKGYVLIIAFSSIGFAIYRLFMVGKW